MLARYVGLAFILTTAPAAADPGDQWKKQSEKRADCEKKLQEAKSSRDFYKKSAECDRELAKLDREQRKEAAKEWRRSDRQRRGDYGANDGPYYRRNH